MDGRVKSALGALLSQQDFRTSDVPLERYTLGASVSFDRRDTDSSVQCSWSLEGNLDDTSFAETLMPFSMNGREASNDFANAQNRAVKALEGKIKKEFVASFNKFLSSIAAY